MDREIVLPDESTSMPVTALVELARAAEARGYAGAWLPDHILPPDDYGATFGGVFEPMVTLAHLAAVTTTMRLGTSVPVAPLRDPFVLAKQAATLHHLSAGRFVLGVGVGWNRAEFDAVGADFAARGQATDDTLALIVHLTSGGGAPYRARRFSYGRGTFAPVVEGRLPVAVGGNSDAALRRAARFADVWQGLAATPEAYAERTQELARLTLERRVTPAMRIGWPPESTAAEIAAQVLAYRQAGAERLAVHMGDHDQTLERMTALAEAVGPR